MGCSSLMRGCCLKRRLDNQKHADPWMLSENEMDENLSRGDDPWLLLASRFLSSLAYHIA